MRFFFPTLLIPVTYELCHDEPLSKGEERNHCHLSMDCDGSRTLPLGHKTTTKLGLHCHFGLFCSFNGETGGGTIVSSSFYSSNYEWASVEVEHSGEILLSPAKAREEKMRPYSILIGIVVEKKVKKENLRVRKSWKLRCSQQIFRLFTSFWEICVAEKQAEQHSGLWGLSLKYSSYPRAGWHQRYPKLPSLECGSWQSLCCSPCWGCDCSMLLFLFHTTPWKSAFLGMGSLSVALS